MTKVAFFGTGAMGGPMAANLARAGFEVRAWNRTRARAEPLAADGVVVCDTPAEATDGADVLVTMLADGPSTAAAVEGALRAGSVWAQMGTVGTVWTERLGSVASDAGVAFVDAPVLGSRIPARDGELTVLASGDDAAIERVQPVFDVVGARTMRLGAAGAATRLKLVFNYWVLGLTGLTSEVLALAESSDVGGASFLELIEGGFADAPYAQGKGKKMLSGDHSPLFGLALGRKDVELALEAAGAAGLSLDVARAVSAEMARAIEAGHGDDDISAVFEAVRPS